MFLWAKQTETKEGSKANVRINGESDYESSPSAFIQGCRLIMSKMHDTAAEYSERQESGVGVDVRRGCSLAACPVGRCCIGLGKQRDKARQAGG